jgi:hypothetical protein
MNYLLSYAGIPLLSDRGQAIRLPTSVRPRGQTDSQSPGNRQQVEPELIDEINRLLELGLIKDNAYPNNYPGKTLSNLAKRWPIYQWPEFGVRINEWFYPHGANQWSVFRGLATSSMVQAMLLQTMGSNPASFIMQSAPISPDNPTGDPTFYTIETPMYLLPPRPLAEHGGFFNGLYLITLVDLRYYFQGCNSTLWPLLNQNTTWLQLINQLATDLGITLTIPTPIESSYGQPEVDSQLWTNLESSAVLLDCVAANVGRTVVRNLDGTFSFLTTAESVTQVQLNRGEDSNVVRLAGGDIFANDNQFAGNLGVSRNAVLPESVVVSYPKYVIGNDPVPHFLNTRYGVTPRPTAWVEDSYGDTWDTQIFLLSGILSGSTGFGVSSGLFISGQTLSGNTFNSGLIGVPGLNIVLHDTAKAYFSGEAQAFSGNPLNVSGLTLLATQLANGYFNKQVDVALDEVYPGTYEWEPEGIHNLVWTYSDRKRLAATRVIRPMWNQLTSQYQHAIPLQSGSQTIVIPPGVGGRSVAQTWRDQGGNEVPGVNLVTVLGGSVSGILYSGGVQEVIFAVSGGSSVSSGPDLQWVETLSTTLYQPLALSRIVSGVSSVSGSTTLTTNSVFNNSGNLQGSDFGVYVWSSGLGFNTKISSINTLSGTLTLSKAAIKTTSGIPLMVNTIWGYNARLANWFPGPSNSGNTTYQQDEGVWQNIGNVSNVWLVGPNGEKPVLYRSLGLAVGFEVAGVRYQCRKLGVDSSGTAIWAMAFPFPQQAVLQCINNQIQGLTLTDGAQLSSCFLASVIGETGSVTGNAFIADVNFTIPSQFSNNTRTFAQTNQYLGRFIGVENVSGMPVYSMDACTRPQYFSLFNGVATQLSTISGTPYSGFIGYAANVVDWAGNAWASETASINQVWLTFANFDSSPNYSFVSGWMNPSAGGGSVYQGFGPVALASGGVPIYSTHDVGASLGGLSLPVSGTGFSGGLQSPNFSAGGAINCTVPGISTNVNSGALVECLVGAGGVSGTGGLHLIANSNPTGAPPRYAIYIGSSGVINELGGGNSLLAAAAGLYLGRGGTNFIGDSFIGGLILGGGAISGFVNALNSIGGYASGIRQALVHTAANTMTWAACSGVI